MRLSLTRRAGLTLMELLVVLAILIALAGVVVPLLTTQVSSSQLDATYQSMLAIRQAIMGQPSYYMDTKGLYLGAYFPARTNFPPGLSTTTVAVADAAGMPATLNDLFVNPGIVYTNLNNATFDPLSQKGWRGPYLNQSMGNLNTVVSTSGGTTTTTTTILNSFPPPTGSTTPNQIYLEWPGNAAPPGSDTSGDGVPTTQAYLCFRLRTPGPSGKLVTPSTGHLWAPPMAASSSSSGLYGLTPITPTTYGDNLILYIRLDQPGIDWTNYYQLKQTLGD